MYKHKSDKCLTRNKISHGKSWVYGRLNSLNKWIVMQGFSDCIDHGSSLIHNVAVSQGIIQGIRNPKGKTQPCTKSFADIKKGDLVVYYTPFKNSVTGIYEVVSNMKPLIDNRRRLAYDIKPHHLPAKGFLEFKQFIEDPKVGFESLKSSNLLSWDKESLCFALSESDYTKIEKALENSPYLEKTEDTNKSEEIGILSGLLDFYSDRATSFASLFVASIFGIVTLAAIIENFGQNYWQYGLSLIPYIGFLVAGSYTWSRFEHYAGIASTIEGICLRWYNHSKLEKLVVWAETKKGDTSEMKFPSYLAQKTRGQEKRRIKKYLFSNFKYFAILLIGALSIVVYWEFLNQIWEFLRLIIPI